MSSLSPLWVGPVAEMVAGGALLDATGWLAPVGSVSPEPIVVALLAVGFVGMSIKSVFDSILSEDGDSEEDTNTEDGLMPEEGGDEFGDLGGGLDDDGDEFGEFEDDEFGDMDGGADTDELEHRLDELETEVGSLSSTVNTVRNENEQISETVDDVEENVRKLLDIYEMVTRGVNPFADDIDAGGLGGPGDDSFGLFDQGEEQTDDELEEDIANADAEGFFDDDLIDDDDELEADADVGDVLGEDEDSDDVEFDDEFDEGFDDGEEFDDEFEMDDDGEEFDDEFEMDDDDGEDDSGGEGGKSFAELKDEYESGDADWAEGEDSESSEATEADGDFDDAFNEDDADAIEDMEAESPDDALADDDLFDTVIDDEDAESMAEEVDANTDDTAALMDEETEMDAASDSTESIDETSDAEDAAEELSVETSENGAGAVDSATDDERTDTDTAPDETNGKPYLTDLPDGFLADLIVVEWLEFLVSEVGVRATAEAIHYYERIDWIDEDVADQLQAYLKGFEEDGESATLTIDHHTKSLRYVSQLNGGGAESVALEQLPATAGGGSDGLQR